MKHPLFAWFWELRLHSPTFDGSAARGIALGECCGLDREWYVVSCFLGRRRAVLGIAAVRAADVPSRLRATLEVMLPFGGAGDLDRPVLSDAPDLFDSQALDPQGGPLALIDISSDSVVERLAGDPNAPVGCDRLPVLLRIVEERTGRRPRYMGFSTARAKDARFYPVLYFAGSDRKVVMSFSIDPRRRCYGVACATTGLGLQRMKPEGT